MKTCTRCSETKPLTEFHNCKTKPGGKFQACKVCRNARAAAQYALKDGPSEYQRIKALHPDRPRSYYQKHRADKIERAAAWRTKNPEKRAANRKAEYARNRDAAILAAKKWAEENPERRRKVAREFSMRHYRDPANRPVVAARKLLSRAIAATQVRRRGRTAQALGYTAAELRDHLEALFEPGMTWANHGEWHIDHKIPVSYLVANGVVCPSHINALSNLQPLWAADNLSKGAKLCP